MHHKVMIKNLFPIPLGIYDLSSYPNKGLLLSLINSFSTSSYESIINGESSYNKNSNILNSPKLSDLKSNIQKCVNDYCSKIGIKECYITNSWFNILEKGGKTTKHYHGYSAVSAAYYVLLKDNSCNLTFTFPNLHFKMNFQKSVPTDYNRDQITIPIKQDHLYLFPSSLEHETEINKEKSRIVVSFNTWYTDFFN